MKTFQVTLPVAGHLSFEFEADDEDAAREKAINADPKEGELTWDILDKFHEGNVCYCPRPWKVEVEELD